MLSPLYSLFSIFPQNIQIHYQNKNYCQTELNILPSEFAFLIITVSQRVKHFLYFHFILN